MAIPKICGIENEFGFAVFDRKRKSWLNQANRQEFFVAAVSFVKQALSRMSKIRHERSKEKRDRAVVAVPEAVIRRRSFSLSSEDLRHSRHVALMSEETDGFLVNGGRFYLDEFHPEYCTPECLTPSDLVAHDKASELVLLGSLMDFSHPDYQIFLHKNNCDESGNSYGSHLNVLLDRKLVDSMDDFTYFQQSYVPFQIVRIILAGGGRLGFNKGCSPTEFQISQRADFFERVLGLGTTEDRPILNLRDEPHGDERRYFRLHDISGDALMCETAIFLRVALTQVVLAMIEDRFWKYNLMPRWPVQAIKQVSRDLLFREKLDLADGSRKTGLEILRWYLREAGQYLAIHPMHPEHQLAIKEAMWILERLEKDPLSTAGELDWTTALKIIKSRPKEEAKANALLFRQISPQNLYQALLKRGKIKRVVSESAIKAALDRPPTNTRAYLRGECIRRFAKELRGLSWSFAELKTRDGVKEVVWENPAIDKQKGEALLSSIEALIGDNSK